MARHAAGQDLLIGQILGHYRIVEKIGAGGMGEVYRARDEHLDRDAAIKVLPPETFADESARKRFRKEAQTLSKVNHPNVATIYDFDTQQSVDFLAMEYIPGITLSEKLGMRPLPEKEVVALAAQLADGLSAAHAQSVTHRDLKPGNLRVTSDGRLKILDFGLAKLHRPRTESSTTESLSQTKAIAGTLPYMAPEQLLGEEIDGRTDIHAAGLVLYEMATGRCAFAEVERSKIIDAILHWAPVPPSAINSRVTSELERIICKCLEKEPENRYQLAKELAVDLRRLQASIARLQATNAAKPAPVPDSKFRKILLPQSTNRLGIRRLVVIASISLVVLVGLIVIMLAGRMRKHAPNGPIEPPRIAVLPFESLGVIANREYIAEGLADEIAGLLAQVRTLEVISPTSVQRFKMTPLPLAEISRELRARYFVTGTVEAENTNMRIRVRMLNASTGIVWARSYDRNSYNSLSVENEVAQDVVRSLAVALGGEETRALSTPVTQNPQAYDAYLRGKSLAHTFNNRGREEDFFAAEEALRRAIHFDPQMAAAYGELAHLYFLHDVERARSSKGSERLHVAAEQALAIDPKQIAALDALAMMYTWTGNADIAYQYAMRVLALNRHDPGALMVLGGLYQTNGMLEESLAAFRKAADAEPLYLYPITNAAETLVMMGRLEEAWQENESASAIQADNYSVLLNRAWIRYHQGQLEEAQKIARSAESHFAPTERAAAELIQAWVYSRRGSHGQARGLLRQMDVSRPVRNSFDLQLWLAEGWALENEPGKSLPLLTRVSTVRPNYPWFARNGNLQSLRGNPDFENLLKDLKAELERNRMRFQAGVSVLSRSVISSSIIYVERTRPAAAKYNTDSWMPSSPSSRSIILSAKAAVQNGPRFKAVAVRQNVWQR